MRVLRLIINPLMILLECLFGIEGHTALDRIQCFTVTIDPMSPL